MSVTAKASAHFPSVSSLKEAAAGTLKCALYTSAHAPSQADDTYYDASDGMVQVSNGNGYATGGVALSGVTLVTAGLVTTLDAADPSWTVTGAGFTYRYVRFYDDAPASNKPILGTVDMGEDIIATAGNTHTIVIPAEGIATATVS
jgi:hypothetical protein